MQHIRNRYYLMLDIWLLFFTPEVALLLRQPFSLWLPKETYGLVFYTVLALLVKLPVFFRYQLYNKYWRYAGVDEALSILAAVGVATGRLFAVVLAERVLDPFPKVSLPYSLPLIDGLLTMAILFSTRYSEAVAAYFQRRRGKIGGRKRVLVVGAGDAGAMIVREMQYSDRLDLEPVAFLDDDEQKWGMSVHGIPVMGAKTDIPKVVKELKVEEVVIAMPTAPGKTIREIVALCEVAGVPSRTMPGMYDIISGKVGVNQLRHVDIEDLLRRAPVKTDMAAVHEFLFGKRVMVTGGGGSIGSELCRQILERNPRELIVMGHGENSVFEVVGELNRLVSKTTAAGEKVSTQIIPVIADTRFAPRIEAVFRRHRPDVVFHAAAHKHVPLMEQNPSEAVTNNVMGTRNLLHAAQITGVNHFVLISTDKAVNPSSIMGATKRVAELLLRQTALATGRPYVAVRFGNVLGSRGSVVLTFRRQIAGGGPVTVTHPDMQRYFMLIPEAVQLVLQAAVLGRGGEIFMLDMGDPVKIVNLAKDMIRLSGLELGHDIDIQFTGNRGGEKLFEELAATDEAYERTTHEKIVLAKAASSFVATNLEAQVAALEAAALEDQRDDVSRLLHQIVPEYGNSGTAPKSVS